MRIVIYGSRRQAAHAAEISTLLRSLAAGGAELLMHPKLYEHLTDELGLRLPGVTEANAFHAPDASLALSIGGDGTFLRTATWVGDAETPVLGINTGTLGYLSALSVEEAVELSDDILEHRFTIEPRTLLRVVRPDVRGSAFALNEVVVAKEDSASMITVTAGLGELPLTDYRADGLIVSTPTGSTAYNLSAGGPIVQPTAPVLVLTPICAHSLGMRPLVVSDDNLVRLRVDGRGRAFRLTLDGRSTTLPMGTEVVLKKAAYRTLIVQRHGNEFPAVLRNKLMFN